MKTQDYYGTQQSTWRRTLSRIAATGAVVALAACQTNVNHERPTGTVLGRVKSSSGGHSPMLVLAFDRGTGRVAHRAFLERGTAFSMPLYSGSYKFYACVDANRDGHCGRDEERSVMYSLRDEVHAGDIIQLPSFSLRRETVAAAR